MTIVLADGTIAKSGGKVVKNVAGYDLHKLADRQLRHAGRDRGSELSACTRSKSTAGPGRRSGPVRQLPDAAFIAAPLRALMDSQMTPSCVQLRVSKQECALDIRMAALRSALDEYDSPHSEYLRNHCGQRIWRRSLESAAATLRRQRRTGSESLSASHRNLRRGCGVAAMGAGDGGSGHRRRGAGNWLNDSCC